MSPFLAACRRQPTSHTPIWLMRQAGRYMPEYRALRAKYDFLTLMGTPELATEVTLQPVERLGVDAAILFSDILVIPQAMGMRLEFVKNHGPRFDAPIRTRADVERLRTVDPEEDLRHVLDAVRLTRKALGGRVPLIGFAGSPWTLAAYMVEGEGSSNFTLLRRLLYETPDLMETLLERLTDAVTDYLIAKVRAGVEAIQIFDTWGGLLTREGYARYSLRPIQEIVSRLHAVTEAPVILFTRGRTSDLDLQVQSGADVVSIDWTLPMRQARQEIGGRVALQGNLDPGVLYAPPDQIALHADEILDAFDGEPGHIFNLGHGIFPDIPVEHVQALVEHVQGRRRV